MKRLVFILGIVCGWAVVMVWRSIHFYGYKMFLSLQHHGQTDQWYFFAGTLPLMYIQLHQWAQTS